MADVENQTIPILRELRAAIKALDGKLGSIESKVDNGFADTRSRMESLRQAINGESVLGRYAVSEVEERLEALERRVATLEKATREGADRPQLNTTLAADCGSSSLKQRW